MKLIFKFSLTALALFLVNCASSEAPSLDSQLDRRIEVFSLRPPIPNSQISLPNNNLFKLGQALFFDKELSGNRDISCSTCHNPRHATTDGLTVSIGTGGNGVGPTRQLGSGDFIARNSQDLFNRGFSEIFTMFTDKRISGTPEEGFVSPAGTQLPNGLKHVLAVQALFPLATRDEMLGFKGENELANLEETDFTGIWNGIVARLKAIPAYVTLFQAAYPNTSINDINITHVANAIAAFEAQAFNFLNSPWDAYVAGNLEAITDSQKRGALLFYGKANCITCHPGNLFFDQNQDNILVPNVGPGKGDAAPLDLGIGAITGDSADNFAFRSAPLRNVELTGPWMHNGAYTTLEAAVRHYLNVEKSMTEYNVAQLPAAFQTQVHNTLADQREMRKTAGDDTPILNLSDDDVTDLVNFLKSLTDPAARSLTHLIPASVPSGLSID